MIEAIARRSSTRWRVRVDAGLTFIGALFFVSGFPALIYQLVWQRALFTIYGINVESVTVVVTGFMAGLGLGSLCGGRLSKRQRPPLLVMFGLIELGIGLFGLASLRVFEVAGGVTLHAPSFIVKAAPLVLLLVPTLLMGATLPILVVYVVQRSGNVGRAVGLLYFVNTLGSATACLVVAFWLMRTLGMQGSVAVAAGVNGLVGLGALMAHRWTGRIAVEPALATAGPTVAQPGAGRRLGPLGGLIVTGLAGYISLSYEILWFRVFSFAAATSALAFAVILSAFLLGVAFGSLIAGYLCKRSAGSVRLLRLLSALIVAGSLLGVLVVPAAAFSASYQHGYIVVMLTLVAATSALLGTVLPLVSHLSIAAGRDTGAHLSYLYLANIVGSVAGSLVTGFVLMDLLGLREISMLLGCLGLMLGAGLVPVAYAGERRLVLRLAMPLGALVALSAVSPLLFDHVWERFQQRSSYGRVARITDVIETKSGVITVDEDGLVYGGGVYDGPISVDPFLHTLHARPFALSLLHREPREVLMIGLGSGAWAQIIAHQPQLERLTVVEINPGYVSLIRSHALVASVLRNPKVEIVIDDGRRWLNRHPDREFDVVVQNTTFFFRANISNLLSREYLGLVRSHLKPGGVYFYNTTSSDRAQRTACLIDPQALRFLNMMVMGNGPVDLSAERWRRSLLSYRIDGKPVLDMTKGQTAERLAALLPIGTMPATDSQDLAGHSIESCQSILARTQGLQPITDDNMGEEWWYWGSRRMF